MERIQEQSISAVRSCTLCGSWCAARLCRWPFLSIFPTTSAAWIWHWSNSPAARPATVGSRVRLWQPGLPQGGRAEPGGTDHRRDMGQHGHLDMVARCRRSSLVCPGPSKSRRFVRILFGALQQPWVVSLSTQHRRSTSGGPLLCRVRSAKAAWLHLSPHGQPYFIMADSGYMAVSASAGQTRHCEELKPRLNTSRPAGSGSATRRFTGVRGSGGRRRTAVIFNVNGNA